MTDLKDLVARLRAYGDHSATIGDMYRLERDCAAAADAIERLSKAEPVGEVLYYDGAYYFAPCGDVDPNEIANSGAMLYLHPAAPAPCTSSENQPGDATSARQVAPEGEREQPVSNGPTLAVASSVQGSAAPAPDDARDAARYRWLRSASMDRGSIPYDNWWEKLGDRLDEDFDAAIDAAMKEAT